MPGTETNQKQLTAAEAAKRVKRNVTELVEVDGGKSTKTRTKQVPVSAEEVLDFKDYGTHVVVVTRDGQKFTGQAK